MSPQIRCLISSESPGISAMLMPQQIRSFTSSESGITGVLDWAETSDKVSRFLEAKIQQVNIIDLEGWRLLMGVTICNTDAIGIFKRARRFPSDKEFEVSISIPVPCIEVVEYGLPDHAMYGLGFFHPVNEAKSHVINPQFADYAGLQEYIVGSAERAIDTAFEFGFKCNGKVIRYVA
ncbi:MULTISPECIES: Imm9 family immunity protein [Stenotrophomonas maltophilia group]|uniref:Imm9 family immunity protein n=1 Tax=Stenotrophomonas hibiscicola TaxID=86189 RepID=A0ABV0C7A8_9GAMM